MLPCIFHYKFTFFFQFTSQGVLSTIDGHIRTVKEKAHADHKPFSISKSLLITFGPPFMFGSALKLVTDVIILLTPQVMRAMITYAEEYSLGIEKGFPPPPAWKGPFLAFLILAMLVLSSLLQNQVIHQIKNVACI